MVIRLPASTQHQLKHTSVSLDLHSTSIAELPIQ
jgi:hypothetical protein